MTENNSTQLAMRIFRVFSQLHPHGCVGHCYFLDLSQFCFDSVEKFGLIHLEDSWI